MGSVAGTEPALVLTWGDGDHMTRNMKIGRCRAVGYGMLYPMRSGWRSTARKKSLLRLISISTVGALVLSACVSGGDGKESPSSSASGVPPKGQQTQAAALQSRLLTDDSSTVQVDVLSLGRISDKILKLKLRITNIGQNDDTITNLFGSDNFADTSLLDGKNMKAYFPLESTQGTFIESGYPQDAQIESGHSTNATIFYPSPPAEITKVGINSRLNPPFVDIPIQGTAKVESGEPDPTKTPQKAPRIEDLVSMNDDLSGDKSVDESGQGTDIRLNSDVLFALNKANLNSNAQAILKDVASRIDKASASTIKVDGYTDNSGNDTINEPLSRRRAESVAKALKKLVTRSGVSYQTAGHGSADPVASNDSATGRKKNRRVTVTIGK